MLIDALALARNPMPIPTGLALWFARGISKKNPQG
jgi:hypothetical protein